MQLIPIPITILSGQSLSTELDLGGPRLCGVAFPSAWTAASLTFQAPINADAETLVWGNLYSDAGTEISVPGTVDRVVMFSNPSLFLGVRRLKVRSGTSGTPVVQAANRTLYLLGVP